MSKQKTNIQRIAVIGNAAAGKTTLSLRLAQQFNLPLTHVDSVQFLPGLKLRDFRQSIDMLKKIEFEEKWIIDGYGPLDLLENRLDRADLIIFIDLPLWRHQFWFLLRQFKSLLSPRQELPENCDEANLKQTVKVLKSMKSADQQMKPELIRILRRDHLKDKVVHIQSTKDLKNIDFSANFATY